MKSKEVKPVILMISTDIKGKGGVASVVSAYLEGGLQKNYNIQFLVTHTDGSALSKIYNFIFSLFILPKFLVMRRCKVFHVHSASRSSFVRKSLISWLGMIFGKKIILHLHGGEFMQYYNNECGFFMKWYVESTFNTVDQVVVLSSQWKSNIQKISNNKNISVIFNPVVVDNNENVNVEKNIILFLGRVGSGKGFWDILNALSLVKETYGNFVFKYAGDGEVEKAKKLISDYGLEHCTEYLGWVTGDEKKNVLKKSLIYLLPSYNEGLPMGVLEAMAAKVAVIASPVGGVPDVINNGVNGLLVPVGDTESLSTAIIKLLSSKTLCEELTYNAYNDVVNKFSVDVIIPEIESLYQALAAS